nr:uncharacterized protein LOC114922111 [Labrus bergylta]
MQQFGLRFNSHAAGGEQPHFGQAAGVGWMTGPSPHICYPFFVVCWGSRLRVVDSNRLNKMILKASDVVGMELDSLMERCQKAGCCLSCMSSWRMSPTSSTTCWKQAMVTVSCLLILSSASSLLQNLRLCRKPHSSSSPAVNHQSAAGADGSSEDLLETARLSLTPQLVLVWPHFSSGSPEENNKMFLLPAVALCCVSSALAAMTTELKQDSLSLTRRVGESVSFSCERLDLCDYDDYVYWYQKKDNETFTRILWINKRDVDMDKDDYNHPQKDDFSAVIKQNSVELQIQKVNSSHSATYYCSCWFTPTVRNDPSRLNKNQQMSRSQIMFVTGRQQ